MHTPVSSAMPRGTSAVIEMSLHPPSPHAIRLDEVSAMPESGAIPTMQIQCLKESRGELHAKLLVDSHSWVSGQRAEQHQPRRPLRYRGHRRDRTAWPRCPWAPERSEGWAARPGRTASRRAERSLRRGWPKRAALTPPPANFACNSPAARIDTS